LRGAGPTTWRGRIDEQRVAETDRLADAHAAVGKPAAAERLRSRF